VAAKSIESGRGFTLDRMRGHDGVSWTLPVHFGVDNWQPAVSTLPPRLFVTTVHNVVLQRIVLEACRQLNVELSSVPC